MTTLRCPKCETFAVSRDTDEQAQADLAEHDLHEHREHGGNLEWEEDE